MLPEAEIIATEETVHHIEFDPDPATMRALVHSGATDPVTRYLLRHFGGFDWSDCVPVLPTRTFTGELDLQVGRIPVRLRTVGPAHTSGDLIVHLPEQQVVFAGDVIFASTDEQPGDHVVHWAGPLSGIIRACQDILDTGAQTIVPGHGPLLDRAGVRSHISYLEYLAERAGALHSAGFTPTRRPGSWRPSAATRNSAWWNACWSPSAASTGTWTAAPRPRTRSPSPARWLSWPGSWRSPPDRRGAYQGSGPPAAKNPPVGPSGPSSAILTMISAPSSTVWWPARPFRSVAV